MKPVSSHLREPEVSFDGGSLDCGSGLLLLIRKHIDPLRPGELLEVRSTDSSVEEDLPAWCRLTGNELVSWTKTNSVRSFLISKGGGRSLEGAPSPHSTPRTDRQSGPESQEPGPIPALAVMGIGSWPRPAWLIRLLHEHLAGRIPDEEFQTAADDAVRLAIAAQERAGVDVISDGEQRRDNYASFIAPALEHCSLVPLTDLLPLVDDSAKLERELQSLDVPASLVRHPLVHGLLRRSKAIAVGELAFARSVSSRPVKVALPGPYLLSRTMWMECLPNQPYSSREELAEVLVTILREEIRDLLAAGAAVVQLDEPVLTEVVYAPQAKNRSFMCGTLSERGSAAEELSFASRLIDSVVAGFPAERIALHLCRGNWSRDEHNALSGDYAPLIDFFSELPIGILFLELCTPRAGELSILEVLPKRLRIGIGVVNQKQSGIESVESIAARMDEAIDSFGAERVLFTPDCGFSTFADTPLAAPDIAEAKLARIVEAVRRVRGSP